MFFENAFKDATNKELSQLINKRSFVEVDRRSLTAEHLQHVVATGWVITTRPNNNGHKGHQVQVLWKRVFTIHPRHWHANLCCYTSVTGNETLAENRDHQEAHSLHNGRGKRIPQYTNQ
eukprot:4953070-Amphidinium_carterae.3